MIKEVLSYVEIDKCYRCNKWIFGKEKIVLANGVEHYECSSLVKFLITEILLRSEKMKTDVVFDNPKIQKSYERVAKIVKEKNIDILKLFKM